MAHPQTHPKIQKGEMLPIRNLALLFLEFLDLYGKHFNYGECLHLDYACHHYGVGYDCLLECGIKLINHLLTEQIRSPERFLR